jgi:hypothetical protein
MYNYEELPTKMYWTRCGIKAPPQRREGIADTPPTSAEQAEPKSIIACSPQPPKIKPNKKGFYKMPTSINLIR